MTDKEFFLNTLKDKFIELQKIAVKNKYKILVPPKKFTTETMLTENFYNNHIFYVSKYDENMYINLNGKVLIFQHPKFKAYLGWKKKGDKEMEFSIKDQYNTSYDLSCISIDNVCDEANYNEPSQSKDPTKTENTVQKKDSMKEYLSYYNVSNFNKEFEEACKNLDYFLDLMKNNYVFMKGYEDFYSFTFIKEFKTYQEDIKNALNKYKPDEAVLSKVVNELTDSLIFSKMYDFIMKNLINFHAEEEEELKTKMKELPNKNELAISTTDEAFKDCKFEDAIKKLKELPTYKTLFEKLKLITDVNDLISKEAKDAYEKAHNKKTYNPQGDLIIAFWSYVVSHSEIPNILAESAFLKHFSNLNMDNFGESNYLSTTFITAVDTLLKDYVKSDLKFSLTQNIAPSFIYTSQVNVPKFKMPQNPITQAGKK